VRFPPATALVLAALLLLPAGAAARTKNRPQILTASVTPMTVIAGVPARLDLTARDRDGLIYGLSVQAIGGYGMGVSGCAVQKRNGKFRDPDGRRRGAVTALGAMFTFPNPGRQAVVARVNSGGCLPGDPGEVSAPLVVWVDVLPA
jgi:hypothetical protein